MWNKNPRIQKWITELSQYIYYNSSLDTAKERTVAINDNLKESIQNEAWKRQRTKKIRK